MRLGLLIGLNFESLKSGFRKSLHISSMLVFVAFFSSVFFIHSAYAAVTQSCGFFELNPECDLSGWMKLFLGDVGIGVLLALLLHFFSRRSNIKIEKNSEQLEKIIKSQEVMRLRRKDYSVQHLKNLFNTLLFTIGIINKSTSNFNRDLALETRKEERLYIREKQLSELRAEEAQMGRVIQLIRNTIISSNDVLEPDLVVQIDGVCTFIGELSSTEQRDGTMVYPKYTVCKSKIRLMMEFLQTYSVATHSFQEPKIENSQNISEESSKKLKGTKTTIITGRN